MHNVRGRAAAQASALHPSVLAETERDSAQRCRRVPYRPEHVDTYHEWMKSPELLEMTESEPLTIEEEREMQQSWARDDDKLTFILLDRTAPATPGVTERFGAGMCGDVNLFLNDDEDRACGEIEVMVAETSSRGKGIGREALELMMGYCHRELGVTRFVAKILQSNGPSIALFEKIGFRFVRKVEVFGEVHYELVVGGGAGAAARRAIEGASVGAYDP